MYYSVYYIILFIQFKLLHRTLDSGRLVKFPGSCVSCGPKFTRINS